MPTVEILDEQMLKAGVTASQIEVDGSSTSVRELLRARILTGIKESGGRSYSFFVPSEAEAMLNADFDLEVRTNALLVEALDAFSHRRFVVLWNGEQVLDPEARLPVQPGVKVTFLRLVPLVGGLIRTVPAEWPFGPGDHRFCPVDFRFAIVILTRTSMCG